MDKERKTRLHGGGINVDNALERFMGNEAMLERYLKKAMSSLSKPSRPMTGKARALPCIP